MLYSILSGHDTTVSNLSIDFPLNEFAIVDSFGKFRKSYKFFEEIKIKDFRICVVPAGIANIKVITLEQGQVIQPKDNTKKMVGKFINHNDYAEAENPEDILIQ